MSTVFLDDSLPESDDFESLFTAPTRALPEAATHLVAPALFTDPCKKCGGSGRFYGYSGRVVGECFTCKGSGKQTFKTSRETRQANRAKVAERAVARGEAALEAFAVEHPDVWQWMDGSTFPFAVSLREAVAKYGALTDRQLAAAVSCVQKLADAKAASAARKANAAACDTSKLTAAFEKAKANGLKKLHLRMAGFSVTPAKASSANAGALYVKSQGTYLGKVMDGKFMTSRDCSPEREQAFLALAADPEAAAIAYGKATDSCSCCGRELTNAESISLGIGPICREKWF